MSDEQEISPIFSEFNSFNSDEFSFLHLNISSLSKNLVSFEHILNSRIFDLILLNETKLDSTYPHSFIRSNHYTIIRRDKTTKEGGLIVFIRKEYKIISFDVGSNSEFNLEYIHFQLLVNKIDINFICFYKPPHFNELTFLDELEELIFSLIA